MRLGFVITRGGASSVVTVAMDTTWSDHLSEGGEEVGLETVRAGEKCPIQLLICVVPGRWTQALLH